MDRLLLVTNAAAGTADQENISAALEVLRSGADVEVVTCTAPEDFGDIFARRDGRGLVLAGGDGSLQVAVAALHARGQLRADDPLGVLPLGTGNDLARTLRIPIDPVEAARTLLDGAARRLDLLVDDSGGVVVNVVHLGVGAQAAEQAVGMKDKIGKTAYAVGGVLAGATATGWELRVEVDAKVVHEGEPVLMVAICNGRSIGGGAEVAPDARPDDGLLDVIVATSTGPLARLGFGVAMRGGDHVEREDVQTFQGRTVSVAGEPFPCNADGEIGEPVPRRTWSVEPLAWSLVAPAG